MGRSTAKRDKPWRRFEQMAARIERALAGAGVVVKTPDKVLDLMTGRMREVDASIRLKVGSCPMLVTMECRKRGARQDDTWIEQLATKRVKIGAAKTIAVSATPFSSSAITTAARTGIELRQIDELSPEDIPRMLGSIVAEQLHEHHVLHNCSFILAGADGTANQPVTLDKDLENAINRNWMTLALFVRRPDGRELSLGEILRNCEKSRPGGWAHLPEDGSPFRWQYRVNFREHNLFVKTSEGELPVSAVLLDLETTRKRTINLLRSTAQFKYGGDQQDLVLHSEFTDQIMKEQTTISLTRPVGTDELVVQIHPVPRNSTFRVEIHNSPDTDVPSDTTTPKIEPL